MSQALVTKGLDEEGARQVLRRRLGVREPELIGQGGEGFVFGVGDRAFKVFRRGTSALPPGHLELLSRSLGDRKNPPRRILPVLETIIDGGDLIIVSPRLQGRPYGGGDWCGLVELLIESRERGLALINIRPDNLLTTPDGLVFVDIGECVRPWTGDYWRNMAERAYLSCQFSARPDLKSLMTRSISEKLPELKGVGVLRSDVSRFVSRARCSPDAFTARDVTLLIRTCFMEAEFIGDQVRHLVRQFDTPRRLAERVVVCDTNPGPFARSWAPARREETLAALEELRSEGVVDRVVAPERGPERIRETNRRWFGLDSASPVSGGMEPTFASLEGFDACKTDLVLQLDSDCLIGRFDPDSDFLGPMLEVLESDASCVSVALPPPLSAPQPFTSRKGEGTWRVGVRCSLLSLSRVGTLRPLPNSEREDGRLALSWYRSLDVGLREASGRTYRGGQPGTFVIHVPNELKPDLGRVREARSEIEDGHLPLEQLGQVDLIQSRPTSSSSSDFDHVAAPHTRRQ